MFIASVLVIAPKWEGKKKNNTKTNCGKLKFPARKQKI